MAVSGLISTVIIGCEVDFRKVKRMSREEAAKLMRQLKDYLNLSYESEATIAADAGVSWHPPNGWLRGNSKPTLKSLLKVREFLQRQPKIRGGIAPIFDGATQVTKFRTTSDNDILFERARADPV